MRPFLRFVTLAERFGLWMAIASLSALVLLGTAEMILRGLFASGLPVSLEYSGYLVAIAFLGGSGWTLRDDGHIRVRFLEDRLRPKARRLLRLATRLVALTVGLVLASGLIAWTAGSLARGSLSYHPSATPLWLPQAALSLAVIILVLSLAGDFIRAWRGETHPARPLDKVQ